MKTVKSKYNYIIRLTNINDGKSIYFTRMVPHWNFINGEKVHTQTVETTKSEKQATTYPIEYLANEARNGIIDWQPEWSKQYDIIVEQLEHPALKLRKLCHPMEELIGLTKTLKIRKDNVDENELKRYHAIYQKMLDITKEIKPMFEEIMKTVE